MFAAAVLSSGAVYLLTRTVIPLVLVGIALCAYCILAGRIAVRVIGASRSRGLGHYLRMAIVPLALLAPVYVLCQLMLFLADGWGIVWKIPPLLRSGLRLPGAVVSGIGDFVSAGVAGVRGGRAGRIGCEFRYARRSVAPQVDTRLGRQFAMGNRGRSGKRDHHGFRAEKPPQMNRRPSPQ
ncbi:MAG: hypothetical protein WDN24_11080 [Sphingomonas sp.]